MPENTEHIRPDSGPHEESEAIPFDDLPLHRRLLTDGERWRAGLPSPDSLVRGAARLPQVAQAGADTPSTAAAPPPRQPTWEHGHTRRGQLPMKPGRIRTIAGAAMAVAVVALFALLLHGLVLSRSGTPTSPGSAPTATAPHGNWHNEKNLSYTTTQQGDSALAAIAPSDPSTVYVATLDPPNPPTLRRTTNAGGSWTNLTLPGDTSSVQQVQVFVSPLSATHVFLAITSPLPPGSDPSACASMALGPTHGGILASGTIPCTREYVSADSGAHWQRLHLPGTDLLVDAQPGAASMPVGHMLRAQGSALFSLVGCGPLCLGPNTDLAKSTDGGLTWSLADGEIRAAGLGVCDFVTAPISTELYAIAATDCNSETLPTPVLWHSMDGGAHWTQIGELPSRAASGMELVAQPGGPAILYIHMPPATVAGHGVSIQDDPTSLQASTDGGHTWHKAPSAGIPSPLKYPYPALPLGVLSDGTVVEGFIASGDGNNALQATLYGWKYGQSSWQQVAPKLDAALLSLSVAPDDTLWAIVNSSTNPQISTIGVETFKP